MKKAVGIYILTQVTFVSTRPSFSNNPNFCVTLSTPGFLKHHCSIVGEMVGEPKYFDCPEGEYIDHIWGKSEDRVDMIKFGCNGGIGSATYGNPNGGNRDINFYLPNGIRKVDMFIDPDAVHGLLFNGNTNLQMGKANQGYGNHYLVEHKGCKAVGATVYSDQEVRAVGFNFICPVAKPAHASKQVTV